MMSSETDVGWAGSSESVALAGQDDVSTAVSEGSSLWGRITEEAKKEERMAVLKGR